MLDHSTFQEFFVISCVWWCTPVNLPTQKAEAGGSQDGGYPGQLTMRSYGQFILIMLLVYSNCFCYVPSAV